MFENLDEAARIAAGVSEADLVAAEKLMNRRVNTSSDVAKVCLDFVQFENLTGNVPEPKRPGFVR